MTRKWALEHLKIAFQQGDLKKATRIYIEHRISRKVYNQFYAQWYRG